MLMGLPGGRSGCSAGLLLTYINSLAQKNTVTVRQKGTRRLPQANIDLPGGRGRSKGADWATRAVNGAQRGVAAKAQPWGGGELKGGDPYGGPTLSTEFEIAIMVIS